MRRALLSVLISAFALLSAAFAVAQAAPAAARALGSITSISGNNIVVKTDSGDVKVTAQPTTRFLQVAPGETNIKNATPTSLDQLQSGDRVLIRGAQGGDSILATTIVVMKQADVAKQHEQDLRDWQRRGVGGLVSAVDAAAGDISIKSGASGTITVHATPKTTVLRYAPNSIQFKDAVKSSIAEIKPGDQLRARGNKSADGKSIDAEEIIAGTFRNIAGTVVSVDAANGSLRIADLATKKTVEVKINSDSQMHKLPAPMAQRVAMMLKAGQAQAAAAGAPAGGAAAQGAGAAANATPAAGNGAPGNGAPWQRPGAAGRSADFQQMLARTPTITLSDLNKGDAVMIVATSGGGSTSAADSVAAITLIAGVEPILTASPNGSGAAELLSNWNVGSGAPGGDEGPQ